MFTKLPDVHSDSGSGSETKPKVRRRKSSLSRRKSSLGLIKEDEEDKPKQKLIVEEQAEEGNVRILLCPLFSEK